MLSCTYLVLFVIMHDVGILYNVVLVFGFVNEVISVTICWINNSDCGTFLWFSL